MVFSEMDELSTSEETSLRFRDSDMAQGLTAGLVALFLMWISKMMADTFRCYRDLTDKLS
jgi:hypothetical protein